MFKNSVPLLAILRYLYIYVHSSGKFVATKKIKNLVVENYDGNPIKKTATLCGYMRTKETLLVGVVFWWLHSLWLHEVSRKTSIELIYHTYFGVF